MVPPKPVHGMLTLDELRAQIDSGAIEQVVMSFPDMYGRLMGKRFDGDFFLSSAVDDGTHCCDYLLANDMEMQPQSGYKFANWSTSHCTHSVKRLPPAPALAHSDRGDAAVLLRWSGSAASVTSTWCPTGAPCVG